MKIYKQNNKLIIYLPLDLAKALELSEDDELDYFKYNDKSFLIAKKADIVGMLTGAKIGNEEKEQEQQREKIASGDSLPNPEAQISKEEILVLKKLDTLRYNQRTVDNVANILDKSENLILQSLLKRKVVSLFSKDEKTVYSIPRDIYDKFLMRKKAVKDESVPAKVAFSKSQPEPYRRLHTDRPIPNPNDAPEISELESSGYIVLQTESEAARISLMLEDSIRHGQVLGTRSFGNKKFFIVTRQFLDRHIPSIFKELREGPKKIADIAGVEQVEEDAARAILYILAENGDITERRKDYFAIA